MWSELLSAPLSFRCHIVDIELDVLVFHLWVQLLMRVLVVTGVVLLEYALLSASWVTAGVALLTTLLRFIVLLQTLLVLL